MEIEKIILSRNVNVAVRYYLKIGFSFIPFLYSLEHTQLFTNAVMTKTAYIQR